MFLVPEGKPYWCEFGKEPVWLEDPAEKKNPRPK